MAKSQDNIDPEQVRLNEVYKTIRSSGPFIGKCKRCKEIKTMQSMAEVEKHAKECNGKKN